MGIRAARFIAILLSGASPLVLTSPALAQGTGSDPQADAASTGLTDIIVTARKIAENQQDVPVAVTAFTGDDLVKQNAQQVENLAAFTPGMSSRQGSSSPTALTITLRGQVQTDILATLDPSVGTYVDGVYWARSYGLNGSLLDIRSVEVLKGPQGTLFGRNTTGGALLISTNDPDLDDFGGRLSVTYGRFNEFETSGVVNVPIVNDRVALRVAVSRLTRDGYTRNVIPGTANTILTGNTVVDRGPFTANQNGQRFDNRDRWSGRAKLLIKPTDTFSLLFSGEYYDVDETVPAREIRFATNAYTAANATYSTANTAGLFVGLITGNPIATAGSAGVALLNGEAATLAANPRITSNNERPYATARTYTYGLTATLDVPWGEAKLITSARRVRTSAGLDLEGSQYPIHFTEGQQKLKQQSAELQTTGTAFGDALDFAAGVFAFHESGFDQSISITVPALNGATSHFYGLIDNDSMGVYAQASYHITPALTFTGGLRYSVDDKRLETRNNNYIRATGATICSVIPVAPFVVSQEIVGPEQCAFRRGDSFAGWSWTAGLDYKFTDDIMAYAKASKGFRSGGQNLRAPSAVAFLPFKPEIAHSYEIGLKSEFFNRRVRLNLAAYTTDVSNIQRTTLIATAPVPPSTVAGTATILSNAGKARIRGVEAELTAVIAPGFTITASGALTDPKYVKFADLSGDRSFERFVGVAKSQYGIAADYSTEISSEAELNLHVNYSWRGDTPVSEYNWVPNPQNETIKEMTTAKALGLLGARIAVEYGNFELAVYGRNLTNERKYVTNLAVLPLGYITGIRQEPRTFGVSGSFKF